MKRPVWTRAIIIHHGHIQRLPRRCSASRSRRRLVGHPEGTAVGIPFRIGATRNHPQGTCCIPCVPRTRPFCDSLEQAQTREQRQPKHSFRGNLLHEKPAMARRLAVNDMEWPEWPAKISCAACTFENEASASVCSVCNTTVSALTRSCAPSSCSVPAGPWTLHVRKRRFRPLLWRV